MFGAPLPLDDAAGCALRAARALARRLADEVDGLSAGIGVSAGRAVAGNIGSESRFEYTVIGDPVNEAARLCELAKEADDRVLASAEALELARAEEKEHWREGERGAAARAQRGDAAGRAGMSVVYRAATPADEPFLVEMLRLAAGWRDEAADPGPLPLKYVEGFGACSSGRGGGPAGLLNCGWVGWWRVGPRGFRE